MQELKDWITGRDASEEAAAETLDASVEYLRKVLAGLTPMPLRMVERLVTADPAQSKQRWVVLALMSGRHEAPAIDFSMIAGRIPQERRGEAMDLLQRFVSLAD